MNSFRELLLQSRSCLYALLSFIANARELYLWHIHSTDFFHCISLSTHENHRKRLQHHLYLFIFTKNHSLCCKSHKIKYRRPLVLQLRLAYKEYTVQVKNRGLSNSEYLNQQTTSNSEFEVVHPPTSHPGVLLPNSFAWYSFHLVQYTQSSKLSCRLPSSQVSHRINNGASLCTRKSSSYRVTYYVLLSLCQTSYQNMKQTVNRLPQSVIRPPPHLTSHEDIHTYIHSSHSLHQAIHPVIQPPSQDLCAPSHSSVVQNLLSTSCIHLCPYSIQSVSFTRKKMWKAKIHFERFL